MVVVKGKILAPPNTREAIQEVLITHKEYIGRHGDDMPSVSGWKWGQKTPAAKRGTTTEGDNV